MPFEDVFNSRAQGSNATTHMYRILHMRHSETAISSHIYMIEGYSHSVDNDQTKERSFSQYALEYSHELGSMPIILRAAFEEVNYHDLSSLISTSKKTRFRPYKMPDFIRGKCELSDFD